MNPVNPADLIDHGYWPSLPAPVWFIQLFKVLGFTLHAVPMNLWYAGALLAVLAYTFGGENARRLSGRLMRQMPFIIAFGVNLGIVPLLFIQVAYSKVFYPATILMAWFWLGVIGLLTVAYYGIYIYAMGLRGGERLPAWRQAAGWVSAVLFIGIGFIFANAMSLSTNLGDWSAIRNAQDAHGAVLGAGLNLSDATLLPRWLMLFGLALVTTAAWVAIDTGWFSQGDSDDYRRWARGAALTLATVGVAWFAGFGSWYVFGAWTAPVRERMLTFPAIIHTLLTGAAPGLTWLLIFWAWQRGSIGRGWAALVGVAQFGALGINAVSRQMVQNIELGHFNYDVWQRPVETDLAPLLIFLGLFVAGLLVVAWMVWQVIKLPPAAQQDA